MKAVEATLQSDAGENKTRLVKLEGQVREAREKLEASEAERELLAARLGQASREKELSRKAIEDGSAKEQVGGLFSWSIEHVIIMASSFSTCVRARVRLAIVGCRA